MNRKIIQAFELEGNGNPLRYPCLGNPMDRGAWRATVHGSHGLKWLNKQLYLYVSMYVCMCVCVCKTLNLSAVYLKYNFVNQLYSKKKKKKVIPKYQTEERYNATGPFSSKWISKIFQFVSYEYVFRNYTLSLQVVNIKFNLFTIIIKKSQRIYFWGIFC